MHIFFAENLNTDIVALTAEESRHCARVLRMQPGQHIGFVNGQGSYCKAELLDVNPRSVTAGIVERKSVAPRPFHLHMAVAPTKSMDRYEWFLEKATECGIEEITPIICSQSERTVVKTERLNKILLAAMKQSQRAFLPRINEAMKFKDFLKNLNAKTSAFIAHCDEGEKNPLRHAYAPTHDVVILIGPEGDFSTEEVALAKDRGVVPISLGQARLRTETAALVACMEVNFINGEL